MIPPLAAILTTSNTASVTSQLPGTATSTEVGSGAWNLAVASYFYLSPYGAAMNN